MAEFLSQEEIDALIDFIESSDAYQEDYIPEKYVPTEKDKLLDLCDVISENEAIAINELLQEHMPELYVGVKD